MELFNITCEIQGEGEDGIRFWDYLVERRYDPLFRRVFDWRSMANYQILFERQAENFYGATAHDDSIEDIDSDGAETGLRQDS